MRTRAKRNALAACGVFVLSACGLAEDRSPAETDTAAFAQPAEPTSPAPKRTTLAISRDDECLVLLWDRQADPDRDFDRRFDKVPSGAISCATDTTPTEFEKAIDAIRGAALARDRKTMSAQVALPLLFIDAQGTRRELPDVGALDVMYERVFNDDVIRELSRIRLQDMGVTSGQGGDFRLGSIWLAVEEKAGRPRIVTINQQALAEAVAAEGRSSVSPSQAPSPAMPATDG